MAKRFFWLVLLAVLIVGCKSVRYVPLETVRTEYREADTTAIYNSILRLFESRMQRESRSDSLIDREKETVVINEHGDTTRHDKERIVYRATAREKELETENKTLRDSISSLKTRLETEKTDSVAVPYPVERELSKWEKTKMDFGGVAIGGLIAGICVAVAWLAMRRK